MGCVQERMRIGGHNIGKVAAVGGTRMVVGVMWNAVVIGVIIGGVPEGGKRESA